MEQKHEGSRQKKMTETAKIDFFTLKIDSSKGAKTRFFSNFSNMLPQVAKPAM